MDSIRWKEQLLQCQQPIRSGWKKRCIISRFRSDRLLAEQNRSDEKLLKVKPDEAILQQMIRMNPALKTLIKTFDLKLISIQHGTPQPKVSPPKKRGFRL